MRLIETESYLLLIDEKAKIKVDDLFYPLDGNGYITRRLSPYMNVEHCLKIIAYYPLTKEAKELDLPLLPNPFKEEIDVEKLALETTRNLCYSGPNANRSAEIFIWMSGYKAAQQSDKQFSLEDMKKAFDYYAFTSISNQPYNDIEIEREFNQFIQSLSTQQLPKEFIPEYEKRCWCAKPMNGGCFECSNLLKTITNSEGKQELVGTYKY